MKLRYLLIVAAGTLAMGVSIARPVDAAQLTYDFDVVIDSGSFKGHTYPGHISVDNTLLKDTGFRSIDLSDIIFSFSFNGKTYHQTDAPFGFIEFEDKTIVGLSLAVHLASPVDPVFTFERFLDEQLFTYTDSSSQGADGFGDVTFTERSAAVPEPSLLPGLISAAGLRMIFRAVQRRKQHSSRSR